MSEENKCLAGRNQIISTMRNILCVLSFNRSPNLCVDFSAKGMYGALNMVSGGIIRPDSVEVLCPVLIERMNFALLFCVWSVNFHKQGAPNGE